MAADIAKISTVLQRQSTVALIPSTVLDEDGKSKGKFAEGHSQIWSTHAVSILGFKHSKLANNSRF